MKTLNLTGWGFILTAIALIITSVGLFLTTQKLGDVSNNVTVVASIVDKTAPRVEMTWALTNLSAEGGLPYIERYQEIVAKSEPAYLEPDVVKGEAIMILTPKGKRILLDTGIWYKAIEIVERNPGIPLNEGILKLNVESLYFEAEKQGIPLDVLIAISATHIQEVQR